MEKFLKFLCLGQFLKIWATTKLVVSSTIFR